jgi:hypothetical protein
MRLGERYGKDRLEAACRRSMRYGLGGYQSVKNILVGNLDRLPEEQPVEAPQGQTLFRFQRHLDHNVSRRVRRLRPP